MTDQVPPTTPPDSQVVSANVPAPKKGPSARTWIIASVVTLLIAGGAIFVLSRGSSSSKTNASSSSSPASGANGGPGGRAGGFTRGTIDSISGSKLAVTATDGTITNVVTNSSTTVSLTIDGTISDIAVGDQISVQGTTTGTDTAADQITDMGDATALTNGQNGQRGPNGTGRTRGTGQTGDSIPALPNGQAPTGVPSGQFRGAPDGQAPNGQCNQGFHDHDYWSYWHDLDRHRVVGNQDHQDQERLVEGLEEGRHRHRGRPS